MPELKTILNAGYGDKKAQSNLQKQNYILDKSLSNKNNFVYVNKDENKFIHNVKGTNPFSFDDLKTDLLMVVNGTKGLKSTDRYKDSNRILNLAKNKYPNFNATITGHSLGSSIGSKIANKDTDKFSGLNGYFQPFRRTPSNNGNFNYYRTEADLVSAFGAKSKNVKTLLNKNNPTGILPYDLLLAHSPNAIALKSKIIV